MRQVAAILVAVALLGGCAGTSARPRAATDAEGIAAPGPDLVGTWHGMAWAVGGTLYFISEPVELTITPDGRWTRTRRGEQRASGHVRIQGDRVVLDEDTSKDTEQSIKLNRSGGHMWGLTE